MRQYTPSIKVKIHGAPRVRTERIKVGGPRRLPGVVLVDARRAYDGEPAQHVARRRAERDHREAAHAFCERFRGSWFL